MAAGRPLGRRGLLGWPGLVALAGCGFHPLYAGNGAEAGPARTGLGLIEVAIIGERNGQLLRQELQARFDHGDAAAAKRFNLAVAFGIDQQGLGTQMDSITTRVRFVGHANWVLYTLGVPVATVTSGSARAVDGLNTFDEQYFAQDMESETVNRRIAGAVAEQITEDLARWFDKHPG
jgi:LPS-assembly lipoprotein